MSVRGRSVVTEAVDGASANRCPCGLPTANFSAKVRAAYMISI